MIHNVLFFIVGFGLVAIAIKTIKIDARIDHLILDSKRHDMFCIDADRHRMEDLEKLSKAEQRITELEEKVKMLEDEVY